jgi:hypothetical protein
MKILFVCLQYIHSARWIKQLQDSEHEIFIFDCLDKPIHSDLLWANYITNWSKRKIPYLKGEYFLEKKTPKIYRFIEPVLKVTASEKLLTLIKEIQPDLVHSLEMQSETYPLIEVRKKIHFNWAYSCWGNDIYFYKNLDFHKEKIKKSLEHIDYCFLECKRDKQLIKSIHKKSRIIGTRFPGGGGYDIKKYEAYSRPLKDRNLIIIKGYEHKFGRALNVLNSLELIIDVIKLYDVYVYSAHEIVIDKIKQLNSVYGINIKYSSRYNQISQIELFDKFGKAIIAIGNNISDGIPNTLLEAIISGAFPIQSNPGGATEEYITHKENGLLINDPNNVKEISELIKKAIQSPKLLKNASLINANLTEDLEYDKIRKKVLDSYKEIELSL